MMIDQTPADLLAADDTQGHARLAQFEDCTLAIDGLFQQALMTTGAGTVPRLHALAHELGHIYCGHVGGDRKGRWPDRSHLPVELHETVAEAVAWLACQRNGVEARSRAYLSSLIGRVDLSQVSLYAIFEAANRVESRTQPVVRA